MARARTATSESTDAGRLMDGIRRIVRELHATTRASEREWQVSAAQLFVLRQLAVQPGQSMGDVAARTRTTQSSVSEVVARLVRSGLVERRTSPVDRRRAELLLTIEGARVAARAPETIQERLISALDRMDGGDRRALAAAMETWLELAGLADVPATMFFEGTER